MEEVEEKNRVLGQAEVVITKEISYICMHLTDSVRVKLRAEMNKES